MFNFCDHLFLSRWHWIADASGILDLCYGAAPLLLGLDWRILRGFVPSLSFHGDFLVPVAGVYGVDHFPYS